MLDDKKQQFHNYLEKKVTELEGLIESHGEMNDASDEAANQAYQKAKNQLLSLNIRLQSLDEEFDICDECGDEIPLARLMAVPTTQLCVNCSG